MKIDADARIFGSAGRPSAHNAKSAYKRKSSCLGGNREAKSISTGASGLLVCRVVGLVNKPSKLNAIVDRPHARDNIMMAIVDRLYTCSAIVTRRRSGTINGSLSCAHNITQAALAGLDLSVCCPSTKRGLHSFMPHMPHIESGGTDLHS